jgi:hypothetical protein
MCYRRPSLGRDNQAWATISVSAPDPLASQRDKSESRAYFRTLRHLIINFRSDNIDAVWCDKANFGVMVITVVKINLNDTITGV